MIQTVLREEMEKILTPDQILYNEPMDRHCSFRTGGPADALVKVKTEKEMAALLQLLRNCGEPCFLLGKGTNLLIGDGGYRGVIVTAAAEPAENLPEGKEEHSPEGVDDFPLDGIRVEFAAGSPGTVGGGLVMNAGAYGGEIRLVTGTVRLLMPDGSVREYSPEQMEFGYRTSILRRVDAAALRARFDLTPGDPEKIRARIADLSEQRRSKQPLEYPSAGSTFKRPEGFFAGKLIMDAGLAGYSVGGAQVSEKHCGFVINRGGANSAQIRRLIEDVQNKVFEDTGIRLEREVIFLGEF